MHRHRCISCARILSFLYILIFMQAGGFLQKYIDMVMKTAVQAQVHF